MLQKSQKFRIPMVVFASFVLLEAFDDIVFRIQNAFEYESGYFSIFLYLLIDLSLLVSCIFVIVFSEKDLNFIWLKLAFGLWVFHDIIYLIYNLFSTMSWILSAIDYDLGLGGVVVFLILFFLEFLFIVISLIIFVYRIDRLSKIPSGKPVITPIILMAVRFLMYLVRIILFFNLSSLSSSLWTALLFIFVSLWLSAKEKEAVSGGITPISVTPSASTVNPQINVPQYCMHCGAALNSMWKFCPVCSNKTYIDCECGYIFKYDDAFCPKCGKKHPNHKEDV